MKNILFGVCYNTTRVGRKLFSVLTGGQECVLCSERVGLIPVCTDCRKMYFSVPEIGFGLCSSCGKRCISEIGLCMQCRENSVLKHTDGVFPIFSYRLWNTTLLCRWKIEGERCLSDFFVECMHIRLLQIQKEKGDFVIVPVPPRHGKIREEGWDQVEELVAILEYKYRWNVKRCLVRNNTTEQKSLTREERMEIIGKVYSLLPKAILDFETVCLVDDVLTTGSTIESCASVLKHAGVKRVMAATLFSVDR